MSLEQSIQELIGAVKALTAAMDRGQEPVGSYIDPDMQKDYKESSEGNDQESATTPKSSPASAQTPTKSSGETKQSDAPAVSYDDVKAAILAIAKESRDKATALLQRYGAKSGKDLTEAQWGAFHADAKKVIAGEYDPTDGE